jgi:riboflavin synthase
VGAPARFPALRKGSSVAVNGACLTLAARRGRRLEFDVVPETLRLTNLGRLAVGDRVNLEPALHYGDRLDGHLVQGHVEALGRVQDAPGRRGGEVRLRVAFPRRLKRRIVPKGSVAVDGVSLTVARVRGGGFEAALVPHTLRLTTLGEKTGGDRVNLETDLYLRARPRG